MGSQQTWRWLRLSGVAATVASAALGVYGFFSYEQTLAEFRDKKDRFNRPRCFENGDAVVDADGNMALPDCVDLQVQYRKAQTLMVTALIGAGVLSAATIALWVVAPAEPDGRSVASDRRSRWTVALSPTGLFTGYRFAF